MFIKTLSGTMEQLRKEFSLDEFSFNLAHEYLKLEPAQRESVREFFYRVIEPEGAALKETVEELEEEYKKSRLHSARKEGLSASSITEESGNAKEA